LAALAGLLAVAALIVVYAVAVEPHWVAVRTIRLAARPVVRLVHITDLHYKGDRAYLQRVVKRINATHADALCFTGDLVEDAGYLVEALRLLSLVRLPMYGVRGNHDELGDGNLARVQACFAASGGSWLTDERVSALGGRLDIFGSAGRLHLIAPDPAGTAPARYVLLVHDPALVRNLAGTRFDLILAGHTHGSQLRFPGGGPLFDLPLVEGYARGLYQTPAGPLYVNPGLGTFYLPIRFGCRPEITVMDI
jgi:predicted MPP superfamily phosphohydrolase